MEDKAEVMGTCRIFQLGGHGTVRGPTARFRDFAFPQKLPVRTATTYFDRAAPGMGTGKMQGDQAVCGKVSDIREHEATLRPETTHFESARRAFFFDAVDETEVIFRLDTRCRRIVLTNTEAVEIHWLDLSIVPVMHIANDTVAKMRTAAGKALVIADEIPLMVQLEERPVPIHRQATLKLGGCPLGNNHRSFVVIRAVQRVGHGIVAAPGEIVFTLILMQKRLIIELTGAVWPRWGRDDEPARGLRQRNHIVIEIR